MPSHLKTLLDVPVNHCAVVVLIRTTGELRQKLLDLGLHPGGRVKVIQRDEGQPLMLAIGDGRIAISRDMARLIWVSEAQHACTEKVDLCHAQN